MTAGVPGFGLDRYIGHRMGDTAVTVDQMIEHDGLAALCQLDCLGIVGDSVAQNGAACSGGFVRAGDNVIAIDQAEMDTLALKDEAGQEIAADMIAHLHRAQDIARFAHNRCGCGQADFHNSGIFLDQQRVRCRAAQRPVQQKVLLHVVLVGLNIDQSLAVAIDDRDVV